MKDRCLYHYGVLTWAGFYVKSFPCLSFPLFSIVLVESIPEGLEFNSSTGHPSIFQTWLSLMNEAQSSIDIASFYWTLTNSDTGTHEPTADQVGWSCDRKRVGGSSRLDRMVCFACRVKPFWRGWLSCRENCLSGSQWTHLRRLKKKTSRSSKTQVTLDPGVFVTLLFRRLTTSQCSYAVVTQFPPQLISSIVSDMLLYWCDVFHFYCTLQLLCTRLLLPVSEISVAFSNTWKLFQELTSGRSTWESSLQVSFTLSSGLWMGSIFTSEVPTWTGGPSRRYTHIQEVDLHTLTWLNWCWINEPSCWFVGKGVGDGHLQLQLPRCRPGEDLWSLLVPRRQSINPVNVAGQIHHPLQQGHAPPAATQQHAVQGLSVCKIFMFLWY